MRRQLGFTLIELVVVVAIIGILAAIAVPAFTEQARKARRAEATKAMGQLQLDMERWRADCSTYADQLACKDYDGDGTAEANEGKYPGLPTSSYYTVALSNQSPTDYTVTATPIAGSAQEGDRCGTYTLHVDNNNDNAPAGTLDKSVSTGASGCW